MKPGIYNISTREYNAIDAIRQSELKSLHVSAKQFDYERKNKKEPSPEMHFGTALHTKVMQPELFDDEVLIFDGASRKGKAWEAFKAESDGKAIILEKELPKLEGMTESFFTHRFTRDLLDGASIECSSVWIDPTTGLACKARHDIIKPAIVYDLKSTSTIDANKIFYKARDYGYREQAAFYLDGLNATLGAEEFCEDWDDEDGPYFDTFVFIFVHKEPPYDIRVMQADRSFLAYGKQRNSKALKLLKKCRETGNWPGVTSQVIERIGISDFEAEEFEV